MTTGVPLSEILPSTWSSRNPRGMNTDPGIVPWSNSSASRTSRKVTRPRSCSACSGVISRIWAFVAFRSSRKFAIYLSHQTFSCRRARSPKSYPGGQHYDQRVGRAPHSRPRGGSDEADELREDGAEVAPEDGVGLLVVGGRLGVG